MPPLVSARPSSLNLSLSTPQTQFSQSLTAQQSSSIALKSVPPVAFQPTSLLPTLAQQSMQARQKNFTEQSLKPAFQPIAIPEQHTKTEQQRQKNTSGAANVSGAVCCAIRALVDNFIGLADAGSALTAQQSKAHETGIPQTGNEIAAATGIGTVAVLGAASAAKVFKSYKDKQKLADASLFYIKAHEQAAQTPEQQERVAAATFSHERMRNKIKREKWFTGGMPMASMGFMTAAQGYTKMIPGSLAFSAAIDAAQIGKIGKEVFDDKPLLQRIDDDIENTHTQQRTLINALNNPAVQSRAGDETKSSENTLSALAAQLRKTENRLEALNIQRNEYFRPKQREQKISAALWGVQTVGAAVAAAGTATMNPVLVGTGLGAVGIAVGANLRYNTRVTDGDRFAPEPKVVDYNAFRASVTIKDGEITAAHPDRLPSQDYVEQRLRDASKARKVAKDFGQFFWKQQKTTTKFTYTLWRNANRVLGFATLGLATGLHGRSKLAAKTYISNHFVKRMQKEPEIFSDTLDFFSRLPSSTFTPPQPNAMNGLSSYQERLNTFYDALENMGTATGEIGKLQGRKLIHVRSQWNWNPHIVKNDDNKVLWLASMNTVIPTKIHLEEMAERYKGLLDIKDEDHDFKDLLIVLHNYGVCCDATFETNELRDEKLSYYFKEIHNEHSGKTTTRFDNLTIQQKQTLEQAEYEPAIRYLWKVARVNARRDIGYYSEYLAGFQNHNAERTALGKEHQS